MQEILFSSNVKGCKAADVFKWIIFRARTMKIISFFIFSVLFTTARADGQVIHVEDPGDGKDIGPNIEAAWNSASDGDTILLPRGNFRIEGQIRLGYPDNQVDNVCLKGMGDGPDGTKLYRDYETTEVMLHFVAQSGMDYEVEVSDILFEGIPNRYSASKSGNDYYGLEALSFDKYHVYLHHCTFQYFTKFIVSIHHEANSAHSVVSENVFRENATVNSNGDWVVAGCVFVSGPDGVWPNVTAGTNNFVFIEDNHCEVSGGLVSAGYGARYVCRYNYISRNVETDFVNMHPARPDWVNESYDVSTRFVEVYKNTIVHATPDDSVFNAYCNALNAYGGEGVFWGNTLKGVRRGVQIQAGGNWGNCYDRSDAPGDWTTPSYPIPYQVGYRSALEYGSEHSGSDPSSQGEGDFYIWDNEADTEGWPYGYTEVYTEPICAELEGYIKEGRDYHLSKRPGYEPYTYPHPRRNVK